MPVANLNEQEFNLLRSVTLNAIHDPDFRLLLYHLNLLVDEETRQIEIPGGLFDEIRKHAFQSEDPERQKLLVGIFGRTLGRNLDMGFFDEL